VHAGALLGVPAVWGYQGFFGRLRLGMVLLALVETIAGTAAFRWRAEHRRAVQLRAECLRRGRGFSVMGDAVFK
jgi:hypothetical protein